MLSTTIESTFAFLSPLTSDAYELNFHFLNGNGDVVSKKKFTFVQSQIPKNGSVWDVFTKNAICKSSLLNDLFGKQDLKEANSAAKLLSMASDKGPLIAVLDMKEAHSKYLPCGQCTISIQQCEDIVCDFIQQVKVPDDISSTACKVHEIFHTTLPLDFVLLEGKLKMDLLSCGGFALGEIDYFLNKKSGAVNFCQFTEFFMNAFKLGQSCKADGGFLKGESYFRSVSSKCIDYQAYQLNTTLYPPLYKQIYSISSAYASALKPAFTVEGSFDHLTQISTLAVGRKI